jgi:23S rRNA pseudouridine955/2504/2580 synthase
LSGLEVLYQDEHLVVIAKPAGLPSVPTADASRPSVVRRLEAWLAARGGPARLGVHQRLDRDTSGVMVFTKSTAADPGLAAQFASGAVRKTYLALVRRPQRPVRRQWRVETHIARVGRGRMASVEVGGVRALTEFRVVRVFRTALLIEARPRTGRKHQIRVHLAGGGFPILGDATYGTPWHLAPRGLLHAASLEFLHPVTAQRLFVEAPMPADFAAALRALARPQSPRKGQVRRRKPGRASRH